MICLRSDSIYQKLFKKHFSKILANIFDMCQIFFKSMNLKFLLVQIDKLGQILHISAISSMFWMHVTAS